MKSEAIVTILITVVVGLLLFWVAGPVLGFVFKHWVPLLIVVCVAAGAVLLTARKN